MTTQVRTKNKKGLAVGLTAGLIGGTAAGLVLGVPGLSGAASNDNPAALVQQVDEPAGDETDEPDDTTDVRPDREPGTRLREMLQPLVDDGTLSADQADAVVAHMVENRPERDGPRGPGRGGPGRGHRGAHLETVTELLGIEAETLRAELQGGATLAEVAEANGVATDELVAALVADAMERIDEAVAEGKITAEEAAEKEAQLTERVTARVNGERPERPDRPGDAAPSDDAEG